MVLIELNLVKAINERELNDIIIVDNLTDSRKGVRESHECKEALM